MEPNDILLNDSTCNEWVTEWLYLTVFLGTADSEVDIVHINRVIVPYTLELLFSAINFKKKYLKNET